MAKKYTILLLFFTVFVFYGFSQSNTKLEIAEKNGNFEVLVFPNPVVAGDYLTVRLDKLEKENPISIAIINVIGKELFSTTTDSATTKILLQKSTFPAGIYILKIKQDNEIRTLRLNVVR